MIEHRKCIICPFGEFKCSSTSLRKTCCSKCSRIYIDNKKKKYFKPPYRNKIKIVEKIPQRERQ